LRACTNHHRRARLLGTPGCPPPPDLLPVSKVHGSQRRSRKLLAPREAPVSNQVANASRIATWKEPGGKCTRARKPDRRADGCKKKRLQIPGTGHHGLTRHRLKGSLQLRAISSIQPLHNLGCRSRHKHTVQPFPVSRFPEPDTNPTNTNWCKDLGPWRDGGFCFHKSSNHFDPLSYFAFTYAKFPHHFPEGLKEGAYHRTRGGKPRPSPLAIKP